MHRAQVKALSLSLYKHMSDPYMFGTIYIFSLMAILPRTLFIKFTSASNYKQRIFFHEL